MRTQYRVSGSRSVPYLLNYVPPPNGFTPPEMYAQILVAVVDINHHEITLDAAPLESHHHQIHQRSYIMHIIGFQE